MLSQDVDIVRGQSGRTISIAKKKTEKSVRQAGRHPALVVRPFCEHHCVVIFDIWHYDINHSLLVPVGDLGAAKELENY